MSSLAWIALALAPLLQRGQAPNDPSQCPYCGGDPQVMARAGVVSHGPFEFAADGHDTRSVDDFLLADVYWIETPHLQIGFALGPYKVPQKEKEKIRAELTRLAQVLPEVDPKTKILDEWLRAHLFAQRCEDAYARFLEIIQREESAFPQPGEPWLIGTPFRGTGPYLGQAEKYEVLLLETRAEFTAFVKEQYGLTITRTQRWNVVERDALNVTIHLQQGDLRIDEALHGHVVFNLAHIFLDGYKHYSYEMPYWIHEGLAHVMEREVSIRYNTFDATEGALAEETRKDEWMPEVRGLVSSRKAPRLAELTNLVSYASFGLPEHFTTWSMIDFLLREHAEEFACILDRLKGRTTPEGLPDGSNLKDVQRDAFQECLGMSYAEFDRAWQEWVGTQVERKD